MRETEALLQDGRTGTFFTAAAASIPCRSIAAFLRHVDLPAGALGFAGATCGKGPPPAAELDEQGIFAEQARRAFTVEAISRVTGGTARDRSASLADVRRDGARGKLTYCMRPNPPLILSRSGSVPTVRRLECGGPIVGLFESATFEEETVILTTGDWLIVFSDGVSEAMSASGDEYGENRIVAVVEKNKDMEPRQLLEALFADVRDFTRGAPQSDDITAMVLRYGG